MKGTAKIKTVVSAVSSVPWRYHQSDLKTVESHGWQRLGTDNERRNGHKPHWLKFAAGQPHPAQLPTRIQFLKRQIVNRISLPILEVEVPPFEFVDRETGLLHFVAE